MKKILVLVLALTLLLTLAACAAEPEPQPSAQPPASDQSLFRETAGSLEYAVPLMCSASQRELGGEIRKTYPFQINGQDAALEVHCSNDPTAFTEYLSDSAQLRTINGDSWGVSAVVENGIVTYNCRCVYEDRAYLVHAEEPETLYFFETQIMPGLIFKSAQ